MEKPIVVQLDSLARAVSERERQIKKVSYKKGEVEIIFAQRPKDGLWSEFSIKSVETPRPELLKYLHDLNIYVAGFCEFGEGSSWLILVEAVAIEYDSEGAMSATFWGKKRLMAIDDYLPFKTPKFYEDTRTTKILPYGCVKILIKLCDEALRYIDGERAQVSLFPPESGADENEAEALH
jgi:hypothetical protein